LARCLIIGCGCRGLSLARSLIDSGHAVRGTTRDPGRLDAIAAAGVDAVLADPDRVATVAPAFEHVSVACVLLGTASGPPDLVEPLHGTRLEMLLSRMLDTTVRGVVYEAAGTVSPELLRGGARRVAQACSDSHTPYAPIDADPADHAEWLHAAVAAVSAVL
jgi:nucleoside-diphosphate-sugar epimerase